MELGFCGVFADVRQIHASILFAGGEKLVLIPSAFVHRC